MNRLALFILAAFSSAALCGLSSAKAEIRIATAGPITGQLAALGEQVLSGAKQAVADVNASGGINGEMLVLEIGDDACDPKQAVAVANQLISKGVVFVAGHFCSSTSIAAANLYAEEDVIMISPASTAPKLTDERAGPGVYRVCGRDDQQGEVAGRFLAKRFGNRRVAFLHDKGAYGKGLADATRAAFEAAGGKAVLYEAYTAGEKDFSAVVSLLKAEGIHVAFIGGYHTEAGLIARQAKEQGLDLQIVSGDALVLDEFWAISGDSGEGALFTFQPDPRANPEAAQVVASLEARGGEAQGYALYTYAAVQVWAEAARKAGSTDFDAVSESLDSRRFRTVLGDLSFDSKGDVSIPGFIFYEWSQGDFKALR